MVFQKYTSKLLRNIFFFPRSIRKNIDPGVGEKAINYSLTSGCWAGISLDEWKVVFEALYGKDSHPVSVTIDREEALMDHFMQPQKSVNIKRTYTYTAVTCCRHWIYCPTKLCGRCGGVHQHFCGNRRKHKKVKQDMSRSCFVQCSMSVSSCTAISHI